MRTTHNQVIGGDEELYARLDDIVGALERIADVLETRLGMEK